jgi:hypothetical protein
MPTAIGFADDDCAQYRYCYVDDIATNDDLMNGIAIVNVFVVTNEKDFVIFLGGSCCYCC